MFLILFLGAMCTGQKTLQTNKNLQVAPVRNLQSKWDKLAQQELTIKHGERGEEKEVHGGDTQTDQIKERSCSWY